MSKSAGNIKRLDEALEHFPGEAVRYALLSAHYRRPLHWNRKLLEESKAALDRLYRAADGGQPGGDCEEVIQALSDDLNTPEALSLLHKAAGDANKTGASRDALLAGGMLMGFFGSDASEWFRSRSSVSGLSDERIEELINERQTARARRDFAAADLARDTLAENGIVLEDSPEGTTWRRS